jgi:hypothetical protein
MCLDLISDGYTRSRKQTYFTCQAFLVGSAGTLGLPKITADCNSDVVVDVEMFGTVHVLVCG